MLRGEALVDDAQFVLVIASPGRGNAFGCHRLLAVDDVPATAARLLEMGATEHEAPTERGGGFYTASVVDPFGNILGVMHNPHFLEILGSARAERS